MPLLDDFVLLRIDVLHHEQRQIAISRAQKSVMQETRCEAMAFEAAMRFDTIPVNELDHDPFVSVATPGEEDNGGGLRRLEGLDVLEYDLLVT